MKGAREERGLNGKHFRNKQTYGDWSEDSIVPEKVYVCFNTEKNHDHHCAVADGSAEKDNVISLWMAARK